MKRRRPAPVIGITTYGREPFDSGGVIYDIVRAPVAYTDAVQRAGGVPLMVPPSNREIERLVDTMDGWLFVGGGDINPARYGADRHPSVYSVDDERDTLEIELLRRAIEAGKPILGICRGIQALNVALGGDLHQHIPELERVRAVDHAGFPTPPKRHAVSLEPESQLAGELDAATFTATSRHHQALNRLGKGIVVVGRAEDGIVEAIELPSHPWCVGVQWHPEMEAGTEPVHQRIFNRFVAAAAKTGD